MSKEEIINIIKEKLDAIEDVDDKVDALAELMNEYMLRFLTTMGT